MNSLLYRNEPDLDWREFKDVLIRSGLTARRPVDDDQRLAAMCKKADIIATCRRPDDGFLIGLARSISDFSYCTYLSDLAVDRDFQGQGIGKTLIEKTRDYAGQNTALILLSAPAAQSYYPHIGMQRHESCWWIPRVI